jgi:amino acid adenylation domain-containing protein
VTDAAGYRISRSQRGLWQLGAAGHARCLISLTGPADAGRLRSALEAVVARHSSLRTTFRTVPGFRVPLQVVEDVPVIGWQVRSAQATELWRDAMPPDTASMPLTATFAPADGTGLASQLVISASPLVIDAAGLVTVAAELASCYAGELASGGDDVTQYIQFSEWQHSVLPDDLSAADYWRRTFDAARPTLALPLVGSSPPGQDSVRDWSPEVAFEDELDRFAREHGAGPLDALLACWIALLARLSAADVCTVAAAVDGRSQPELVGAVGPYEVYLPVTVSAGPGTSVADVLTQVIDALKAHAARVDHVPQADLGTRRFTAGYQQIAWPAGPLPAGNTRGVSFSLDQLEVDTEPFEIKLVRLAGGPARLRLRGGPGLGDRALAIIAAQLERVIAADKTMPLGDVDLTTEPELAVMAEANATARDVEGPALAQHLFELSAAAAPQATAVACGEVVLSYAALDDRANQIAAGLRAHLASADPLCAIWLEPGTDLLAALLAVWKADAAYLPLGSDWPASRVREVLARSGADLLLSQPSLIGSAAEPMGVPTLSLTELSELADPPLEQPMSARTQRSPGDLAYVMYTSGSTGEPKGVSVTHGGLVNYLRWAASAYRALRDGSFAHTSVAFDMTITSLLAPLAVGGCVHISQSAGLRGLAETATAPADLGLLKITPAHLRLLTGLLPPERAATLARCLVIGGEALTDTALAYWRQHASRAVLINEYGPTETVVGCCVSEVTQADPAGDVPIGSPIDNTQMHVLDDRMRLAPLGVAGELYVGGAGVARGYLRRPDLTAESFVPDPFSARGGERLYRTGDLVRRRLDGTLVFIGRADDQQQVNGIRVEPAEIEAVLAHCPGVAAAAVCVRRDAEGTARLLGYAIPAAGSALDQAALRQYLAQRLPAYLVPASITLLAELPITQNGKLDRSALPEPGKQRGSRPVSAPAGTNAERVIAAVWAAALGLDVVGIDDNFFDLGGHSFLLIEVAVRLQDEFGAAATPLLMLENPTVRTLAAALRGPQTPAEAARADAAEAERLERVRRQRDALSAAAMQAPGRGDGS